MIWHKSLLLHSSQVLPELLTRKVTATQQYSYVSSALRRRAFKFLQDWTVPAVKLFNLKGAKKNSPAVQTRTKLEVVDPYRRRKARWILTELVTALWKTCINQTQPLKPFLMIHSTPQASTAINIKSRNLYLAKDRFLSKKLLNYLLIIKSKTQADFLSVPEHKWKVDLPYKIDC